MTMAFSYEEKRAGAGYEGQNRVNPRDRTCSGIKGRVVVAPLAIANVRTNCSKKRIVRVFDSRMIG